MLFSQIRKITGTITHKWLRFPYTLHVRAVHRPKRKGVTVVFIHGLGATGKMWQPVIRRLPPHINIASVDLLGFGRSAKPYWESYSAKLQARSLRTTLAKHGLTGPVIIVGHSLGSLVAIEFATLYPKLTKSLILCSPPIYRHDDAAPKLSPEKVLRAFYEKLLASPKTLIRLYNFGRSTKIDPSLELTEENMEMFAASMRASIINQTAIDDITKLTVPIDIIHGVLDPLVIRSNLVGVTKKSPNITLVSVRASHPLNNAYVKKITGIIEAKMTQ